MKREKDIYSRIIESSNIYKAILNASKRKKARKNVMYVVDNIDKCTEEIRQILINESYVPNEYEIVKIMDGVRKKERIICKPKFYPDQVIHWALMLQLEPLLKKGMYDYCCGSVKNRGILYAAKYLKKILIRDRKNTKYCLKLDVKKFYDNIVKPILKAKIRRIVKDKKALKLIDDIIDSYGNSEDPKKGVPIGNYTSQWLANYYLQDLDHFIKEKLKIKYYVRYMDDMVLFSRNKKELHKCKLAIEEFLNAEGLELKENWQLFKTESRPLDFLGYRFYRGYTTLRKSNFLRIKRRAKKIYKKKRLSYADATAIISYYGWLKHCDSHNFNQKYIKPYINLKKCKGVIRNESRKQYKAKKQI